MTQAILKVCTASVRRAAVETCGGTIQIVKDRGPLCKNRENHLNPMITGFCHSGWHEGQKVAKPTCRNWVTCPCDCHTILSRMAALTETDRMLVDNSTWVPDRTGLSNFAPSEYVKAAVMAKPDVKVIASSVPGVAPDRIEREFAPTTSGRAARGQLDSWVQAAIEKWLAERPENCTPQWLSAQITAMQNLQRGPSTGAIDAVFKRWAAVGYAVIGTRPTRFVSYTPAGLREGLEVLKARAKR